MLLNFYPILSSEWAPRATTTDANSPETVLTPSVTGFSAWDDSTFAPAAAPDAVPSTNYARTTAEMTPFGVSQSTPTTLLNVPAFDLTTSAGWGGVQSASIPGPLDPGDVRYQCIIYDAQHLTTGDIRIRVNIDGVGNDDLIVNQTNGSITSNGWHSHTGFVAEPITANNAYNRGVNIIGEIWLIYLRIETLAAVTGPIKFDTTSNATPERFVTGCVYAGVDAFNHTTDAVMLPGESSQVELNLTTDLYQRASVDGASAVVRTPAPPPSASILSITLMLEVSGGGTVGLPANASWLEPAPSGDVLGDGTYLVAIYGRASDQWYVAYAGGMS